MRRRHVCASAAKSKCQRKGQAGTGGCGRAGAPEGDAYTAAAGGEAGISTASSSRAVTEAEGQRSPFPSPDSVPEADRGAGSSEKPLCSASPRGPAARSPWLRSRAPLGGRGAAPLLFPAPAARACAPLSAPLRSGATGGFSMERLPLAAAAPCGGRGGGEPRRSGARRERGAPAARGRSEAGGELLCLLLPELSPGRGARSTRPTSRYARLRRRAPRVPASPAPEGVRAARRTDRRRNGELRRPGISSDLGLARVFPASTTPIHEFLKPPSFSLYLAHERHFSRVRLHDSVVFFQPLLRRHRWSAETCSTCARE